MFITKTGHRLEHPPLVGHDCVPSRYPRTHAKFAKCMRHVVAYSVLFVYISSKRQEGTVPRATRIELRFSSETTSRIHWSFWFLTYKATIVILLRIRLSLSYCFLDHRICYRLHLLNCLARYSAIARLVALSSLQSRASCDRNAPKRASTRASTRAPTRAPTRSPLRNCQWGHRLRQPSKLLGLPHPEGCQESPGA